MYQSRCLHFVNRPVLVPLLDAVDTDHLDQNAGDLSRRIELALALAALGREVAHQILVGVAQNIVPARLVGAEVKLRALENGDQPSALFQEIRILPFLFLLMINLYLESV